MPRAPDLSGHALDGRYELRELIGEGTFGCVYRGVDKRLARPVAVKVIKPWWSEDPEWARRFGREARLLARVSDPGIVQIYDVGEADEGIYYVAELVEGESLAGRLRAGALPPSEARDLATQLCAALAGAHAEGVVHRDVKPANVLVSANGRVKVGDFGVALLAEGTTDGGVATVVGTPRYMAPEQARGEVATPATDVYSVGVVLYEMLAGRPPFAGTTSVELAMSHLNDPPPPLPDTVPVALQEIVLRALAKQPDERYASASAMGEALAQATGRRPETNGTPADTIATRLIHRNGDHAPTPVAPRLTKRQNVNPSARRRTAALFAAVVGLLLAMAAGAILLAQPASVRVPNLRGETKAHATAAATHAELHPSFASSFNDAPKGTVVAQAPGPGTKVDRGARIQLTLSAGPPPVKVPQLDGEPVANARQTIAELGLRAVVAPVAAPGVAPGTVTHESPSAGAELARGSTLTLSVAEAPRWRAITSFAGTDAGRSVPFRIRGTHWRIVYSMGYDGTCTLLFICSGPNAKIATISGGSSTAGFDLSDGSDKTKDVTSNAGVYQITITPGSDTAHWSVKVEDYY